MDSTPIRWSGYEHEHIERGSDWFWALGIAAGALALISGIFGNVLFGLVILIAAATLGIIATKPPPLVEFELTDRGVRVGDVMHKFEEILAFWVEDHEVDPPILLIDTPKWMTPDLIIPLEGVDAKAVRAFMKERSEEVPMKEPIAHKILEFFGLY